MTYIIGTLLFVVGVQTAAVVMLLIGRKRRTRAEQALRVSEERYRGITESVPILLWTAQKDTTLDYFNRACMEFSGMPIEKLLANGWFDAVHPQDRDDMMNSYMPAIEARRPFLVEYRARRADGAYRWLLAMGVPKYTSDGTYDGYVGCDVDITERKNAEDLIRESQAALEGSQREIQQLAGRLIEAQDAERARVARDLHDDVSQQLAALSIAISSFKRRLDELHVSENLKADLRALHQRTAALAENVRHVSHDLHPTVLRHAGLVASLTSYCAELERTHGTVLRCSAVGDFESIAPEVALCLYRIAQEALRNVIAHAGASRADVRLRLIGGMAEVTIADDGKGFDVERARSKGLGLVSITERARFAGGTVSIETEPNQGTRVWAQIQAHAPLKYHAGHGDGGRRELSLT